MFASSGNYSSFDRFGRTISQTWKNNSSGATLDRVDYIYDYAGNRLTRNVRVDQISGTYSDERDQDYEHDGLHRLKDVDQGTASNTTGLISTKKAEQQWTLDQLGNWAEFRQDNDGSGWDLVQPRSHNPVNEVTAIDATTGTNWADPVHDAAGNMTVMPDADDPISTFYAKYDAWNRLVDVSGAYLYEYDGLGRRIVRNVDQGDEYSYYYNDQWQLLTEVKDGDVEAIYQWHPFYIDALGARMRANDTHFFLHDANYNVTAAVLDSTDAVVERYAYTPYGEVTFLNPDFSVKSTQVSDIGNTHLYTGRERDPETGLQLNRNRFYASHLGRWLTRDPIGYLGGSANLYGYVFGEPLHFVDPTGLDGTGATIGAIIGGGIGAVGGAIVGGVGGTLVAPGPGTVGGAGIGAVEGGAWGGAIGGTIGAIIGHIVTEEDFPPFTGPPGGTIVGGKQSRCYGPDGYPQTDVDTHADHGAGTPHGHDWGRPEGGGKPSKPDRGPGRPLRPNDPPVPLL